MKQLVVIPAFNSHNTVSRLIDKLSYSCPNDILVVDDGSDIPIKINNKVQNNLYLIRNSKNSGKGSAIKKSIEFCIKNDYTHFVTIDSDLQHDPNHIELFLSQDETLDCVFGKRDFAHPMPIHRRFSNFITSLIISIIKFRRFFDTQCGYRRYSLSLFRDAKLLEDGFQAESEIILYLIGNNHQISHVNISTIYFDKNESNIKNSSDTIKFIKLIFRYVFSF